MPTSFHIRAESLLDIFIVILYILGYITPFHLCPKLLCFQFQFGLPICLFRSTNFEFGSKTKAIWNAKSEIVYIEVLDITFPKR